MAIDYILYNFTFRRLYRELCLYKQILDTKSDFSKLCVDCKSFKPLGQTATAVSLISNFLNGCIGK